jgi:hypothetical protein
MGVSNAKPVFAAGLLPVVGKRGAQKRQELPDPSRQDLCQPCALRCGWLFVAVTDLVEHEGPFQTDPH